MKRLSPILVLVFSLFFYTGAAAQVPNLTGIRGLYVNQFDKILGNKKAEDSLLDYAKTKNITYFTLYSLHNGIIGNPNREQQLSDFITRAKVYTSVKQVGAALETPVLAYKVRSGTPSNCLPNLFSLLTGLVDSTLIADVSDLFCFNQLHTGRFDWINIEYEYWLAPAEKRDSVFAVYINTLKAVQKIVQQSIIPMKIESYLGWPSPDEVKEIDPLLDRVMLHAYRKTPYSTYAYLRERLRFFADDGKETHVIPIFSTETDFMHDWVRDNSLKAAEAHFLATFNAETATWKNNIKIDGYQWFTYSDMPKNNMPEAAAVINTARTNRIEIATPGNSNQLQAFPNPADKLLQLPFEHNLSTGTFILHVYDTSGKLISQQRVIENPIQLATHALANGIYYFNLYDEKGIGKRGKFEVFH